MKDARWLLPFTDGLDTRAIYSTLRQAKSYGATIVAVSLCTGASQEQTTLENTIQEKIFLKTVQRAAEKYSVLVEQYQVFTRNAVRSIKVLLSDLHCTSLIVAMYNKQGVLLSTQEVRYLLLHEQSASLVLIRLPLHKQKTPAFSLAETFFPWLRRGQQSLEATALSHPAAEEVRKCAGKSG